MLIVLFLGDAAWVQNSPAGITHLDGVGLMALHALSNPVLDALARLLALTGTLGVLLIAAIAGGVIEERRQPGTGLASGALLAFAALGGDGILHLLKILFHRPRPTLYPHLFEVSGASFPSGHAFLTLAVYGLVAVYAVRSAPNGRRAAWYAIFWGTIIVFTGLSRIYSGVHYPTDVIAGWLLGALWLLMCLGIDQQIRNRTKRDHPTKRPAKRMAEG